jgi:hypothetical protein
LLARFKQDLGKVVVADNLRVDFRAIFKRRSRGMAIRKEILDELLAKQEPKTLLSSNGLFGELKKALAERGLNAELETATSPQKPLEGLLRC